MIRRKKIQAPRPLFKGHLEKTRREKFGFRDKNAESLRKLAKEIGLQKFSLLKQNGLTERQIIELTQLCGHNFGIAVDKHNIGAANTAKLVRLLKSTKSAAEFLSNLEGNFYYAGDIVRLLGIETLADLIKESPSPKTAARFIAGLSKGHSEKILRFIRAAGSGKIAGIILSEVGLAGIIQIISRKETAKEMKEFCEEELELIREKLK